MKTFFIVVRYWTYTGLSKPHSSRIAWIAVSVELRPAMRTAGSPFGITLKIRKVSTEMANITSTIAISRRTMKRAMPA